MLEDRRLIAGLIEACREIIATHADRLSELDRAIGDGDHGTNMRRGCEAVFAAREEIAALPLPQAIERIGTTLVMSVGGAAGPLYGTLLIEIGRRLAGKDGEPDFGDALDGAIAAVARRGKAARGEKTLLDVLYPVQAEVVRRTALGHVTLGQIELGRIAACAEESARSTIPMRAMRGRASFLGDRSIGHMDPGASSCALLTSAICRYFEEYRPA